MTGVALLIYRRRTTGPVFMATTVNDKVMYLVLVLAIIAGLCATAMGSGVVGEPYKLSRDRGGVVQVDLDSAAAWGT